MDVHGFMWVGEDQVTSPRKHHVGHLRFRWLPVDHAELVLSVGLLHCGSDDRVWRGGRAREGPHLRLLRLRDDQLLDMLFFLRPMYVGA